MQLAVFCILLATTCTFVIGEKNATNKSVIYIQAMDDLVLGLNNAFRFKCNTTQDMEISLMVDDEFDSKKLDRITNVTSITKTENIVTFTFSNTTAYDNGTTFMCGATNETSDDDNITTVFSDTLTIQVQYTPMFVEGNNETILKELPVGETSHISCTVMMANPNKVNITFMNETKDSSNVVAKMVNDSLGQFIFTKANVSNRGGYSCMATNAIGSTYLTFNTFVGGVPDKMNISLTVDIINSSLMIALGINDMSDAPALAISISIPGVIQDKVVSFLDMDIPVHNEYLNEVDDSLTHLEAGNYSVIVTAHNEIGHYTVINETRYIPGLEINVNITTAANVTQGENFTFTCKAAKPVNFSIVIDHVSNSTKIKRLVTGKTTNMTREYIFVNTTYLDNGTVFQCIGNGLYASEKGYMNVLYQPIYTSGSNLVGVNGTKNVTINIPDFTSNPPPTKFTWMKDGKEINASKRVTPHNATALVFTMLLQEDMGNYTVIAENSIGKGNGSATLDVEWPPYSLSKVHIPQLVAGNESYELQLNISANPPIDITYWFRNGKDIFNETNVAPGTDVITFLSLEPKDNGSYTAVVENKVGKTTIPFNMMVLYAPIITSETESLGGFLYSQEMFNITVKANPSNYTTEWMKDMKPIKKSNLIELGKDYILFKNLSSNDEGNYSVEVTNCVDSNSLDFLLTVYDGPFFAEGASNTTSLSEIKVGSDLTITCTIKSAKPAVTELKIEPATGPNWVTKKNGLKSVNLTITNATILDNRRLYKCIALNNVTESTLGFNNYVGGVPDKMKVKVTKKASSDSITLSFNVSDNSSAPATAIQVIFKKETKNNVTLELPSILLNNSFHFFSSAFKQSFTDLTAGSNYTVEIYGINMIGSQLITKYSFSVPHVKPVTHKKKSHTLAIALGVTIPVAVILLIAIGAGGFCYYRKSKKGEYSPLSVQDGDGRKYESTD